MDWDDDFDGYTEDEVRERADPDFYRRQRDGQARDDRRFWLLSALCVAAASFAGLVAGYYA